jgi:hypothetical protein
MVKTNDLKKGTKIKLSNGWEAKIEDNKKGTTRMATVYGTFTEMGSVYAHDIVAYEKDGQWLTDIEYTKDQLKCKQMDALF